MKAESASQFWFRVQLERALIFESLKRFKEQPQNAILDKARCRERRVSDGFYLGYCYIIPIEDPNGIGVCAVDINLAGQRVAEGTFRLATDEEIKAYKAPKNRSVGDLEKITNEQIRRTGQRQ